MPRREGEGIPGPRWVGEEPRAEGIRRGRGGGRWTL